MSTVVQTKSTLRPDAAERSVPLVAVVSLRSLSDERAALIAATLIITVMQIFFSSFLLSILGPHGR